MSFAFIDWSIVLGFVLLLCVVVYFANRNTKSVRDFVAANRCAGRYLLAIASGAGLIGFVITHVLMIYNGTLNAETLIILAQSPGWIGGILAIIATKTVEKSP